MHTEVRTAEAGRGVSPAKTTRVAVAGATGYTGQELLRILARHPAVAITAAAILTAETVAVAAITIIGIVAALGLAESSAAKGVIAVVAAVDVLDEAAAGVRQ